MHILRVVALSEYNQSAIQCVATSFHGDQVVRQVTPVANLFVQGTYNFFNLALIL